MEWKHDGKVSNSTLHSSLAIFRVVKSLLPFRLVPCWVHVSGMNDAHMQRQSSRIRRRICPSFYALIVSRNAHSSTAPCDWRQWIDFCICRRCTPIRLTFVEPKGWKWNENEQTATTKGMAIMLSCTGHILSGWRHKIRLNYKEIGLHLIEIYRFRSRFEYAASERLFAIALYSNYLPHMPPRQRKQQWNGRQKRFNFFGVLL